MKKIFKRFFSMQFALALLIILAIVCSAGSFITQGQTMEWYAAQYSERAASAIILFGLNDVFHCWWFVVLALILCANLLGCNLIHFPQLIRRMKQGFQADKMIARHASDEAIVTVKDPDSFIKKMGFRKIEHLTDAEGRACRYAVKNKIGLWGAWLTHLGILIVIIGFGLGQMLKTEYTVYGVAGQTKPVGDTRYDLTIDDFSIDLREDDTVEQYTAHLTMTDRNTGESRQGEASVNDPFSSFGMTLYQNSTGWAADVGIKKDGEPLQMETLCAGEHLLLKDKPEVAVVFAAFYPDYTTSPSGMPATASGKLNNPAYLYRVYYHDQVIGMNVLMDGEVITLDEYEIAFSDPQSYTLIQIKHDQFQWLAAIGGVLVMIALILAFYLRTAEIWAIQIEDGSWKIGGYSKKGSLDYIESIKNAAQDKE